MSIAIPTTPANCSCEAYRREVELRAVSRADEALATAGMPTYSGVVQHLRHLVAQAQLSDLAKTNNGALAKGEALLAEIGDLA